MQIERREMEIKLEERDAADWVYRGEGAANIVLAYTGSSPHFIGKVIRIKKSPANGSKRVRSPKALSAHECILWRDTEVLWSSTDKDIADQLFVQHIMSPLFGSDHVDSGIRVLVTTEFLELVEKNVISQRPGWRVDAGRVDTLHDSVLLLSDHSLFPHAALEGKPCISVEIKPKCGFLPWSRFIAKKNAIKWCITRFEMHQALKFRQGEISDLSDYNPLDLFSGSKDRIHKAIKDLFSTPQNNLRVFLNGCLIFGSLGGSADCTNLVIGEAFEDALEPIIKTNNGLRTDSFLQLVTEIVYKSGVLDRLLEVQKLDKFDIEGAIHAYYDIISEACPICEELDGGKVSNRYGSLHLMPFDLSMKLVKDFLIAATAKDCSLMISFRPSEGKGDSGSSLFNTIFIESISQFFEYKVYFVDLDLKPLKNMEEYYELDKKIVSYYTETVVKQQVEDKDMSSKAFKCTLSEQTQ